ncbi:MAG: hypothetical protein ACC628_25940, partial [Pirellulaceae bacterium]
MKRTFVKLLPIETCQEIPNRSQRTQAIFSGRLQHSRQASLFAALETMRHKGICQFSPIIFFPSRQRARPHRTFAEAYLDGLSPLLTKRMLGVEASEPTTPSPVKNQFLTSWRAKPQMRVHQTEMNGEAFVDSMEAEDARRLEVAPLVEIAVLGNSLPRNQAAWQAPHLVVVNGANDGFDNEPFPDEVRQDIRVAIVQFQILRDQRLHGDRRQEPHSLHPLSHCRHQPRRQLIRNHVQPQRV